MSLVERLGFKTLKHLYAELDNNDIMEWAAYDMIKDSETAERLKRELDFERQRTQSLEEESDKMRLLFMQIGNHV